jgi:rare lipoprotein A
MRPDLRRATPLRLLAPLLAIALLLAACGGPAPPYASAPGGQPQRPPHPIYKVGAPYQIGGAWYTPRVDYRYDETGTASWYGEAFEGRYTANGELFELNDLTAAHRTLPLPSIVEVTNLRNGRSLRLRVNDRGPFAHDRILDVSRRAAQLLGFETAGTTPVRVRILPAESMQAAEAVIRDSGQSPSALAQSQPQREPVMAERREPEPVFADPRVPEPVALGVQTRAIPPDRPAVPGAERSPAPAPAAAGRIRSGPFAATPRLIFVQAGSYTRSDAAMRAVSAIAGLGNVAIVTTSEGGNPVFRVQLGPVATGSEAEALRARLHDRGYAGARVVVD